ncbi:bacterio-opsin activator domain-containing protein [Halolamina sediminis]|uniref:bacterio-opsin activator domain-containing protein n=1 Tax=Halolamina sediminis TaxID=1480675 RepID=UPI0006B65C90|nr:bacterio-opsin activator domain-containing protein [Halolamina sediminis]
MDDALRKAPIGVIETTPEGQVTAVNDAATAVIDLGRGDDIREHFPRSAAGTLRAAFDGGPSGERSFVEYYPEIDRWLAVDVRVGEDVVVYVRDRTEHRETERAVERLEQRLDRVQRINALVTDVLQRVIDADDRVDVGETVCERLGGTDLYRFAWVGEREFPAERLRTLAAAGSPTVLQDRIGESLSSETRLPEQVAVETGETQLVTPLAADDRVPRGVRRAAFGNGLQSSLVVPLAYQGSVYGVVSVYSADEAGFSQQERAALETLGSVAGFAIRAIRQEGMLAADTVTQVTLSVTDGTLPFTRAAREAGSELSLEGVVPRGEGAVVCYLRAGGAPDAIDDVLSDDDRVTDVRWVRSEGDSLVQATLVGESPVRVLINWGATVNTAEYAADSARLVAAAPPDGDVRRMVEAVDARVDGTELVSKTKTARRSASAESFRDALDDRLTDRQRAVLRTAYLSDYFTSPRGSTAEEVADTLDITGSTMLYHLRRAQRKLIEAFLSTDRKPATRDSDQ